VALAGYEAVRLYDAVSYALEPAALVADAAGSSLDAARLLGAADRLRSEAGVPIWGPRLSRFETLRGSLRHRLGKRGVGDRLGGGAGLRFRGLARRGSPSGLLNPETLVAAGLAKRERHRQRRDHRHRARPTSADDPRQHIGAALTDRQCAAPPRARRNRHVPPRPSTRVIRAYEPPRSEPSANARASSCLRNSLIRVILPSSISDTCQ
jgi:hypothetical protein